ncbi:hypothetical protein GH714_038808 [Hevea brasiliensis]|uniref:Glycosyltransferase n=1 Tax=Hevea brasiliensis TaxID=3981 RepID=A0A6A6KLJ3_HEVBR|nr:hypothetical protein GH714_038808 [Hevea brasiliensis]
MSHSHLIPFTEMAKLLAHRGLTVTIIITPLNAVRYSKIIQYAKNFNLQIQFVSFPFPSQEAGLPEGCENRDSVPSPDLIPNFVKASNMLQEPLEKWLQGLESQPSCIISDICFPWTSDVSLRFNIPRIVFHGISCFTLFCSHILSHYKVLDSVTSDSEPFSVPDIPDRIEFTKAQLPEARKDLKAAIERYKEAELSAEGVVVNSFEELEPAYVEGYRKVVKKIWCIGPLSLYNTNEISSCEHESLKWLDSKKQSSVLYVCFGSLCHFLPQQLIELGMGLKASNHPFVWVVKEGDYSTEFEKWLVEEQFEEKLEGRGLVVRGWAPQVLILSHPAIGGFMTHCGWNSTLEGISAGVPMITWPMFAEQFHNEKVIAQVLKIGVRVGAEVIMKWGEEKKLGVLVKRENIKKAIKQLMDEGEEGEDRRERATQIGKMAKSAVEEGGSSHLNMTLLIQHVMQLVSRDDGEN